MRMSPATKMMVMSDRYGKSASRGRGGNEDHSPGSHRTSTAMGHTYDRTQDMARSDERYGRDRNASRSHGYDPDVEVNERGQRGEDDDRDGPRRHRDGAQRMYAAGVAWTDSADRRRDGNENHSEPVTEERAMEWVREMSAADGTQMPKYKPEQAEQLRKAICPECEQWEWYVAIHMMYVDYCEVAKKLNVAKDDFFALMAKAFLTDEDAKPHKLARYMEAIPKD